MHGNKKECEDNKMKTIITPKDKDYNKYKSFIDFKNKYMAAFDDRMGHEGDILKDVEIV